MKYRLGFVTNSSSSSFIFGKPNENTITVDNAKKFLISSAKELIDIFDKLDKLLYNKSNIGNLLKIVRNDTYRKMIHCGKEIYVNHYIEDYIEKTFSVRKKIAKLFKSKGINLTDNSYRLKHNEIDLFSFFWSYFSSSDVQSIKEISNGNIPDFIKTVDFREKYYDDEDPTGEIVYWYLSLADEYGIALSSQDEHDLNTHEDEVINRLGHKYLGEVAIYGDEGPYMPVLLKEYLRAKSNYGCTHMG